MFGECLQKQILFLHAYNINKFSQFIIRLGFYSWRNTTKGSWFMQSLCHELLKNGKRYDILTLLTFVCQRVAVDFGKLIHSPDCGWMNFFFAEYFVQYFQNLTHRTIRVCINRSKFLASQRCWHESWDSPISKCLFVDLLHLFST